MAHTNGSCKLFQRKEHLVQLCEIWFVFCVCAIKTRLFLSSRLLLVVFIFCRLHLIITEVFRASDNLSAALWRLQLVAPVVTKIDIVKNIVWWALVQMWTLIFINISVKITCLLQVTVYWSSSEEPYEIDCTCVNYVHTP